MRTLLIAISAGLAASTAAMAETLDFSKPDEDASAFAEQVLEPWLVDARAANSPIAIWALKRDLNGDGTPETVGQLNSAYVCGGMGPCFFVIMNEGKAGTSDVFNVPGVDIAEILDTTTDGWHDLKFTSMNGETTWRWDGTTYAAP